MIPPFAVPDEGSHFVTTYCYSGELLGDAEYDEEGNILVESAALWETGKWVPIKEFYVQYVKGALGITESVEEEIVTRPPLGVNCLGYLPQTVGVSVARLIGANPEQILLMGRLFALLWYCFIMFWAVRFMPEGKKIMLFVIGILPMTMQQVMSYNYDSVLLGVCFFITSYLCRLIYDSEKIRRCDYVILLMAIIVIAAIKFLYLPIIGLGVLIPCEKFGGQKQKLIGGAGLVVWSIAMSLLQRIAAIRTFAEPQPIAGGRTYMSALYFLEAPLSAAGMFWRTVERQFADFVEGLRASPLGYPAVGVVIPSTIVMAFAFVLFFSILKTEAGGKTITAASRCYIGALSALACLLVLVLNDCTAQGK